METNIVVVRHGETEWSVDGRHTGLTDIPLTANGEREARGLGDALAAWDFAHRFSSPLQRAMETAKLSGVPGDLRVLDDLVEWDYGIYEGRTAADILAEKPGWSKWDEPNPGGESVEEVGVRVDRAIETLVSSTEDGPVIVFAHGHLLAVLVARWLGFQPRDGRRFVLETGTISVLGVKRSDRVLRLFNQECGGEILPT